ncbi:Butyrophilin-like protein 3 [Labeo rohita]|uniref:Butyrophilin-like protein 3 n=1 Tax=Labeo rohita TaxID=84645 RepID=A0ABQ8L097_LABRO|nr:Butyrophilin-like protein 3 [Labeo rohita]
MFFILVSAVVGHPPVVTVDGFDKSERLHLQCESEGWYPEPVLEWLNSEGVKLSSETTETHRNADRFSVKHTITVQHSGSKIHCRVKLRHHVLETQIVTSNKSFNPWRTSVILSSIAVALIVIAGMLIAAFVHKNRGKILESHTPVYIRPYSSQCMSEQMRIMRSKELPEELRDRTVARHRSGQGYKKNCAALKVPKSTVASIILKRKTIGTTRTLPRAGRPAKLSYRGGEEPCERGKEEPKDHCG